MKKYELFKENEFDTLFRIRALRNFEDVKAGDVGGFVESEQNLSHDGNCWIYHDAKVFNDALIYESAKVFGNAQVFGNALVYGNASVFGNALVYGNASVFGNAKVFGNARVYGKAYVYGNALVYGNAKVFGSAKVFGHAKIYDVSECCDTEKTQECSSSVIPVDEHVENYLKSTDGTVPTKDVVDLLTRLGVSYTIHYT